MKFFTSFSLRNPVAIVLLVILITVGGVYATLGFKQEQQPEIAFPGIMVTAVYPGAAPNEVMNQVTLPLEKVLRNMEGVKSVTSQSANSVSMLQLEFSYNDDMKKKQVEVTQALGEAQLPEGVSKPEAKYFSTTNQPIMYSSVTAQGGVTEEQLANIVKNSLLPDLQAIEGVSDVQIVGLKDEGVYITLDAAKMAEKGITFDQITNGLQANNLSIPLGEATINQNNLPVFVQGDLRTIDKLKEWNLTPDGVKLTDIAVVKEGKDLSILNRTNGGASVNLNIVKSGDANTVEVSEKVLQVYENAEKDGQIKALIMYDRATDVKDSVNTLAREGALGALFASILILFFLRNFRATLIAIVSIPLSMLIAMICLKYFTDVTLNIMTLGGLAVATGRVVDDSIVVIENIVRRTRGEKISKDLILSATAEVGRAITSSTITTVAVFAPLGLLSGMVGGYFRPFAWTVGFALLSSLIVALTVVPLMAWALMRNGKLSEPKESAISRGYKRVLQWSLGHKAIVLVVSFMLFIGSLVPIFAGKVGVILLPQTDYKYIFATLEMPKGSSLAAIESETKRMDEVIRANKDVENTNITVGAQFGGDAGAPNIAVWFIGLDSKADLDVFIDDMRDKVKTPANSEFSLVKDDMGGGGMIGVTVTGSSMDDIRDATKQITTAVQNLQGTDNVSNNLQDGTQGIAIEVREKDASKYGLSAAQASFMLRPFLTETNIGRIGDGSKASDLFLALSGTSIASTTDISNLKLLSPMGTFITVKDIADVKEVQLPSTLQYKNGAEYATVSAQITDKNVNKVNDALNKALEGLTLPAGVKYSLGGSNEEVQQMIGDMLMAMMVAVGMVYIVMVIAFREGRAPLAVLFSLPFALIGGLVGTLAVGEPLSVSSMIGFLMLIGIVVTNAIVLIERVQQQIEHGLSIRDALLEAGGTRLRPILMTAIATICALMPLAIGLGGGSIISSGLAVVVIGGLTSSTLLTLVVVPVMYELLYFKRARKQLLNKENLNAAA